jgi:hypothetical protein
MKTLERKNWSLELPWLTISDAQTHSVKMKRTLSRPTRLERTNVFW